MMMWAALGGGALLIGVVAIFALGGKKTPPPPPPAAGYQQMQAYSGPAPDPKASSQPAAAPQKTREQLAAERRQEEEKRIEQLVSKLEREMDPATIQKEADWAKLNSLIGAAEKLVGFDPQDRRSKVEGTLEQKKEAKAKADEALELLSSNRTFSRLIGEFDEAIGESPKFEFFQSVRNRVNTLRMRLKGI
ncbi:MAG: hypothetical protein IPN34_17740 [Planctomycetes bacterium]|nr:hypothetical protein [Planctomycetota bacterium]